MNILVSPLILYVNALGFLLPSKMTLLFRGQYRPMGTIPMIDRTAIGKANKTWNSIFCSLTTYLSYVSPKHRRARSTLSLISSNIIRTDWAYYMEEPLPVWVCQGNSISFTRFGVLRHYSGPGWIACSSFTWSILDRCLNRPERYLSQFWRKDW